MFGIFGTLPHYLGQKVRIFATNSPNGPQKFHALCTQKYATAVSGGSDYLAIYQLWMGGGGNEYGAFL